MIIIMSSLDIPKAPKRGNCNYNHSDGFVEVELEFPDTNVANTDLDYVKVEVFDHNTLLKTALTKVPDTTTEKNISIYFTNIPESHGISDLDLYINATVFDKCGQKNLQPFTVYCSNDSDSGI